MVRLAVEDVGLEYTLHRQWSLARRPHTPGHAGGEISTVNGRSRVTALRDVSFELHGGDRLGLVGTNGAGKTTLLKVLYGIYEPSHGTVLAEGRIDALFNINLGFRRDATGMRNIELRGLINGWSQGEIDARVDEIVEFSELGEFIDAPFKTYSQGMAARLAFAIATSFEPEILLMDEWLGAGDPAFQDKARARMQKLTEAAGIVVLASHNHALLQATCNKILELSRGQTTYFGDAATYFDERPMAALKASARK